MFQGKDGELFMKTSRVTSRTTGPQTFWTEFSICILIMHAYQLAETISEGNIL